MIYCFQVDDITKHHVNVTIMRSDAILKFLDQFYTMYQKVESIPQVQISTTVWRETLAGENFGEFTTKAYLAK